MLSFVKKKSEVRIATKSQSRGLHSFRANAMILVLRCEIWKLCICFSDRLIVHRRMMYVLQALRNKPN